MMAQARSHVDPAQHVVGLAHGPDSTRVALLDAEKLNTAGDVGAATTDGAVVTLTAHLRSLQTTTAFVIYPWEVMCRTARCCGPSVHYGA
jgi:hypothetical protein